MSDEKLSYIDMLNGFAEKVRGHAVSIGSGLSLSTVAHYTSLAAAQCYAITIARTALHGGPAAEEGEKAAVKVFTEQLASIRKRSHDAVVAEEARRAGAKS